jgi:hypothetical protein
MAVVMELVKMIEELRSQRTAIEQALAVLERLARGQGKRRGRPPAWLAGQVTAAPARDKTRVLSEEVRKKMAEGQKKRWAAYRKAKQAGK